MTSELGMRPGSGKFIVGSAVIVQASHADAVLRWVALALTSGARGTGPARGND